MNLVKINHNGEPITELLTVCKVYGKLHYSVMRDIREIIKDLPSLECEFIKTTYKNRGKDYPTYYLTEKGFYILSSSFKGKKAREFQSKFFDAFKALQEENKLLLSTQYITENTYCISDIAQKFKDLSPMQAQHELYNEDYLEYRKNGLFPTEFYDKNNTIVSVLDTERNRYYPRYTSKGVIMVENYFLDKGYKFKG